MPVNPMDRFDFTAVLAASIHDLKNSLGSFRTSLSHLAATCDSKQSRNFAELEYQTGHMNNILMQLLILYKIDIRRFTPGIDAHVANDILEEVLARQGGLPALYRLQLESDCAAELLCYCDDRLLCSALEGLLINAQRYARRRILLSAARHGDFVAFSVEDDGPGFTAEQLQAKTDSFTEPDLANSHTGLGLFFVSCIARMHTHGDKTGHIAFDNASRLGGARFTLFLP